MSAAEKDAIRQEINPLPGQQLYFTSLKYGDLYDMFSNTPVSASADTTILLVCGIARPEPLLQQLKQTYKQVFLLSFPDHYYYDGHDLDKIKRELDNLPGNNKLVVTTEKDAVRLQLKAARLQELSIPIAVMPVEISFLFGETDSFNNYIFDYVEQFGSNHV